MKKITFIIIVYILTICHTSVIAQINSMKSNRVKMATNSTATVTRNFVQEGTYFLRIVQTGKYCGVEGINPNNGARLIQWDYADNPNHKFQISSSGDGYYLIKAIHSDRYLNVEGQNIEDGSAICQWDYVDQDNLKWSFHYNSQTQSYTIKNKQSGKELGLQTHPTDASNAVLLCIKANSQQTFMLQNVAINSQPTASVTNVQGTSSIRANVNSVDIKLPDGTGVRRSINPTFITNKNSASKKIISSEKTDETCETKTARIDMETKDYVPVTASRYLEYNAPGLIYDVRTFYSGDYTNKQIYPYGENRNPITIATTVRNTSGGITEEVATPTKNNINTAITNLQRGYTLDRLQTTNQNMIYKSSYVENNTEMQLKLGASGKYVGFEFQSSMEVKNSKTTKTFYIEAEKELFTLSTEKPQAGFLNTDDGNMANLGYISTVTYGVKVIGKIEIENSEESLQGYFSGMFNAGFAGGRISLDALSREAKGSEKCFFYVIGGTSDKVEGVNLADAYNRVNQILSTVNYKTCMPIRLEFRSLTTGNPIAYKDATNNFTYEVCTPKAIKEANKNIDIKVNSFTAIGSDIELYGDIWVEVWSPKHGDLKRFRTTNNSLFSLRQNVHLTNQDLARYAYGLPTVSYKDIPAEFVEDAEVHIYYNLFDYNTVGRDDFLRQRGGNLVTVGLIGNIPQQYFRTVIPAKEFLYNSGNIKRYSTDFVDGDGVTIGIDLTGGVVVPKK